MLAALVLMVAAQPVWVDGGCFNTNQGTTATVTLNSVTAGHLLVVTVAWPSTVGLVSVQDNFNDPLLQAAGPDTIAAISSTLKTFTAIAKGGNTTVTATIDAPVPLNTAFEMFVDEYDALAGAVSWSSFSSSQLTTAGTVGPFAVHAIGDLAYTAVWVESSGVATIDGGFVLRDHCTGDATADARITSLAPIAASLTFNSGTTWFALMVELSGDAGPPDAGPFDSGVADSGMADSGVVDAGFADAGTVDSGNPVDAGAADAGFADGGSANDAGATDAGVETPGAGDYRAACGCDASSAPVAALLLLMAMTSARRKR